MSSSDSQDTPSTNDSTSSYTDSTAFSDPTSASETVASPASAEPQQFQPPAPFSPPPPFEPPAPFGTKPAEDTPPEPYAQAIDPLTAEPVPQPAFAVPDSSAPVYAPVPQYAPAPVSYPYNPYATTPARPPQDNGMAIAGLVCSLVGICSCVTVIVGLILGHIGLAKANRGEAGGRGMALAAVIIAYVVIALYAGFFGTLFILSVNGELD
ncbi:hypothetical protein SD37_35880 [Amycolatopsis orientalis]|uniref:DUF4190 domain-containing protein n=1 Tax=Amycolatopsis orientalis TaxID=31958 RepID=A0A193C7U3_AMYOR|nr:DUF4190 domain-containing protein [Amycolatopsis orientalis]ANN20438.1 hypothetical protein SD37_35880 [Amycolatopsis orientalis]